MPAENGAILDEIGQLLKEKQIRSASAKRLVVRANERLIVGMLALDEKFDKLAKKVDEHEHPEPAKLKMLSAIGNRVVLPVGVALILFIGSFLYGLWTHSITVVLAVP
jgi:hypothetical protein